MPRNVRPGAIALIVLNWDKVTAAISRAIAKVDEFQRKVSGPLASAFQKANNLGRAETELGYFVKLAPEAPERAAVLAILRALRQ